MTTEGIQVQEELKFCISRAPILIKLDYGLAKMIKWGKHDSDNRLIIVGVDSSWMGAGWTVYQVQDKEKQPAIFGSCTFNEREQNYGQAKTEVYGVFWALKELWHWVWEVHFQLDHDALSLVQMIHQPDDVPNAPILRWVVRIQLFDFEPYHMPATAFRAEDGLSQCGPAPEDKSYEDPTDPDEFLDAYINMAYGTQVPTSTKLTLQTVMQYIFDSLHLIASNPCTLFHRSTFTTDISSFYTSSSGYNILKNYNKRLLSDY